MNWARLLNGSRRSAAARARATSPVVEALEGRQLMSAAGAPAVHGGILAVTGTNRADDIRVTMDPAGTGRVVVDVNGKQYKFARKGLREIRVDGRGGNDFVGADPTYGQVRVPLTLIGGGGRDTLVGGAGKDALDGGTGADVLLGRAGKDALDGGKGADWLDGGTGRDAMADKAGRNTFVQTGRRDTVTTGRGAVVLRQAQADPVTMPWDKSEPQQQPIVVADQQQQQQQNPTTPSGQGNGNSGGVTPVVTPPLPPATDTTDTNTNTNTDTADNNTSTNSTNDGTANNPSGLDVDSPQPQPEPVPIYDGTLYTGKPDLTQYGLKGIRVQNVEDLLAADKSTIVESKVRSAADAAAAKGVPLIIDQEIWSVDVRYTPAEQVTTAVQKMVQIANLLHAEQPMLKVGYYGSLPIRDYWTPVLYYSYLKSNPTYAQQVWLPKFQAWQAADDALKPVADAVDIICPSLYTFYDDPAAWAIYAQANIDEAKRFGKPVLPFLMSTYHDSNATLGGQSVPAADWKAEIDLVRASTDGAVVWGGWQVQWDPNAAWWQVVQNEISQSSAAASVIG